MSTKELKRLGGGREADRLAEVAAAAFAETAADRGLIDVAVGEIGSPVGELLLAVTPRGLAYVAFEDEERDELLARLSRQLSPRILEHPAGHRRGPAAARRVLRRRPDSLRAETRPAADAGIARDVLAATAQVPFGRTTTYGTLAERIGRPRASRAVGNALGSNPIPIVVPCHRVLRAGGDVGGYAGGPSRKRRLLTLEGSLPPTLA